jgi:hypothetical protein
MSSRQPAKHPNAPIDVDFCNEASVVEVCERSKACGRYNRPLKDMRSLSTSSAAQVKAGASAAIRWSASSPLQASATAQPSAGNHGFKELDVSPDAHSANVPLQAPNRFNNSVCLSLCLVSVGCCLPGLQSIWYSKAYLPQYGKEFIRSDGPSVSPSSGCSSCNISS